MVNSTLALIKTNIIKAAHIGTINVEFTKEVYFASTEEEVKEIVQLSTLDIFLSEKAGHVTNYMVNHIQSLA